MLASTAEPVDVLRKELHLLLRDLDDEIRTSFPVTAGDLSRRVAVAEISAVHDLTSLARQALVGGSLEPDQRCTSAGQALDLRDGLALAARDVRLERERVEAELSTLQLLNWPGEFLAALQRHLQQEGSACADQEEVAQRGRQRAAALRAIVKDVSDVVLSTLGNAARLPPADAQQRRALGAQALAQTECAVCAWLQWTSRMDEVERQRQASCPPLQIACVLVEAAAQDAKASSFLSTVRQTMKLRRQQLRLQGSQQRLSAVLVAGEALATLQARVQLT